MYSKAASTPADSLGLRTPLLTMPSAFEFHKTLLLNSSACFNPSKLGGKPTSVTFLTPFAVILRCLVFFAYADASRIKLMVDQNGKS